MSETDATTAVRDVLTRLSRRNLEIAVEIDAGQPWPAVSAALAEVVAGGCRRLRFFLFGAVFQDAADLSRLLQQCYETIHATANMQMLRVEEVDVLPQLEKHGETGLKPCRLLCRRYSHVVVGGTFDHLHAGHKLLLAVAACMATEVLAIGLSGAPLLREKRGADHVELWEQRRIGVSNFLLRLQPQLAVFYEELHDGFGPALRSDMHALVVSEETETGATAVNIRRQELHLNPLRIVVIPLVPAASGDGKESSTSRRLRLVGIGALASCWECISRQLDLPHELSDHWLGVLYDLAEVSCSVSRRRAPIVRLQSDLKQVAKTMPSLFEELAMRAHCASALALCVTAAGTPAPGSPASASQQQAALLQELAKDASFSIAFTAEVGRYLFYAARPRVLGLVLACKVEGVYEGVTAAAEELLISCGASKKCLIDLTCKPSDFVTLAEAEVIVERALDVGSPLVLLGFGHVTVDVVSWVKACDVVWALVDELSILNPFDADAVLPMLMATNPKVRETSDITKLFRQQAILCGLLQEISAARL